MRAVPYSLTTCATPPERGDSYVSRSSLFQSILARCGGRRDLADGDVAAIVVSVWRGLAASCMVEDPQAGPDPPASASRFGRPVAADSRECWHARPPPSQPLLAPALDASVPTPAMVTSPLRRDPACSPDPLAAGSYQYGVVTSDLNCPEHCQLITATANPPRPSHCSQPRHGILMAVGISQHGIALDVSVPCVAALDMWSETRRDERARRCLVRVLGPLIDSFC